MNKKILIGVAIIILAGLAVTLIGQSNQTDDSNTIDKSNNTTPKRTTPPEVSSQPAPTNIVPQVLKDVATTPVNPPPKPDDYTPPETQDPKLAVFVNRKAIANDRIGSQAKHVVTHITNDHDSKLVANVLADTKDNAAIRNEAANLLRAYQYPDLAQLLISILRNPEESERFRAYSIQHLQMLFPYSSEAEQAEITKTLSLSLDDPDRKVKREALLALARLNSPIAATTAAEWLKSQPEEKLRTIAIRTIRTMKLHKHISDMRKLVEDSDELVSRAAIVALAEFKDTDSIELIKKATQSKSLRVKRAAEAALKRLSETSSK